MLLTAPTNQASDGMKSVDAEYMLPRTRGDNMAPASSMSDMAPKTWSLMDLEMTCVATACALGPPAAEMLRRAVAIQRARLA